LLGVALIEPIGNVAVFRKLGKRKDADFSRDVPQGVGDFVGMAAPGGVVVFRNVNHPAREPLIERRRPCALDPAARIGVLRIKARGRRRELVTVIGHAAVISAGEWVTASGEWINDHTHGRQYKAKFLKISEPTSLDGIEKYLGSPVSARNFPISVSAWRRPV
jgi:hypothetical protein